MREAARLVVSLLLAVCAALGVAVAYNGVTLLDDEIGKGSGLVVLGAALVALALGTTSWLRSRHGRPGGRD